MTDVFMETAEQVLERLGVDVRTGLTNEEAHENIQKYGQNILTRPPQKSLLSRIWDAAVEPMVLMLIVAAVIAFGINFARSLTGGHTEYIECIGILVAVFLSIAITIIMEGKSAKAFEALTEIKDDVLIKAFRNAEVRLVNQKEIAVGDIIIVETGDKIPADGRLLDSISLRVDESSLTGESDAVKKEAQAVYTDEKTPIAEQANMLYSGTFVTEGAGRMVVTSVGDKTEIGQIARELSSTEKSMTPLQEKLADLGKVIAVWGSSLAGLAFIIQVIIFVAEGTASLETVSGAFITSIVLIVASVPEGLPTIVAVSLAINIIKMSKQNALVKKMVACETIGSIDVICSDKTGTLTENKMSVTAVYSADSFFEPSKITDKYLLANFCINGTAEIGIEDDGFKFIGNPTECALLVAAYKSGTDYKQARRQAALVYAYPFSSETKNMTTVVDIEGQVTAFTKGSPEKILEMCSLSDQSKLDAQEKIYSYQEQAGRVIAFAHKEISLPHDFENQRQEIEQNMIYDGFVVIKDPLRHDVFDAVQRCRMAGIDVKMLTGDNIITAKAIAEELHMFEENKLILEAKAVEELTDEELADQLSQIRVIARSTPLIKMRVVNALKSRNHVVAVTGDGINDAPAIKNADIGVAMGISGTEVSKEASDIVLLDDSFSTIVKAVQWGRGIYENFQRFIQFQLTVNLSSVIVVLASILVGFKAPFTALQLLWVNIIMDGPPALTLGLEPIRGSLMDRKPIPRDASIVDRGMLSRIIFNGLFISLMFMGQSACNFLNVPTEQGKTVLFTSFVVMQLMNAFNCRELSETSIFKNFVNNRLMLVVFAFTFFLQVVITQYGGAVFGTVPLSLETWGKIVALSLSVIVFSEFLKLIKRVCSK